VPTSSVITRLLGQRVRVLPPLVDSGFRPAEDREVLRRELGLTGSPLVGMVSTFQASRRHGLGVESFARLREKHAGARMVLVGDGERVEPVRQRVRSLGLEEAVTFAGYQRGEAFVRWLRALDEVWVLGLGNDWSARAAAQARACGVRVVAVVEGNLPSLADAWVEELTPEAVVAASESGTRALVAHPSNARIAADVLALYEQAGAER
jgi:glycosyltransferase involved in cell wall biosynthesis